MKKIFLISMFVLLSVLSYAQENRLIRQDSLRASEARITVVLDSLAADISDIVSSVGLDSANVSSLISDSLLTNNWDYLVAGDTTDFRIFSDSKYQALDADLDNPDIPLDEISDSLRE